MLDSKAVHRLAEQADVCLVRAKKISRWSGRALASREAGERSSFVEPGCSSAVLGRQQATAKTRARGK
jgi:hypothetical protein